MPFIYGKISVIVIQTTDGRPTLLTAERRSQLSLLPPPVPGQAGDGITLHEIFAMLRRRLRLILAVAALGTALAILVGHQIEPQYRATAALMIDPLDGQMLEIAGAADAKPPVGAEVLETQVALITSRSVIEPVMRDLGLLEPQPGLPSGAAEVGGRPLELPAPFRQLTPYLPESWLPAVGRATDAPSAYDVTEAGAVRQGAIDHFTRDLDVRRGTDSFVITISYTDPDPRFAARVANAVTEAHVSSQLERRRLAAGRAADWLQERLEKLRETVARSEREETEFRAAHGLYNPGGSTFNEQRMLDGNRQLIAMRDEQLAKEAKLRRARQMRAAGQNLDALAESLGLALIAGLRAQEATLRRQEAELAQTYGARHPMMVNVRAQINEVQATLRQEIDRGIRNLEDELAILAGRERALAADLAQSGRKQETDQQAALRLRELERQTDAAREHYEAQLRRFRATQEQESLSLSDAQIISPAVPPEKPSTPGPRVFAMVGFTVFSIFGGLLALVLERLNRQVRSAAALEQALGVPVLGLMPRLPTREARRNVGRYMVEKPLSEFAESARTLLVGLQVSQPRWGAPALLVTSALPEEGKSTLCLALALAAARSGFRVLLVDLDLRRPALSRRLSGDTAGAAGLVDYLEGHLPFQQLVQHEPNTGIDFVLAGRSPADPLAALQSPRLRHLIETVRKSYDYVILDSAPLLAVAEARTVARLADRVVLATRWRWTDTEAVSHAVRMLLQMQAQLAGCVLTDVRMSKYKLYATDAGSYYGQYRRYYAN
jgi:capsular exopolysaccharide synthesis family protein